jgi:hypothetical protein
MTFHFTYFIVHILKYMHNEGDDAFFVMCVMHDEKNNVINNMNHILIMIQKTGLFYTFDIIYELSVINGLNCFIIKYGL